MPLNMSCPGCGAKLVLDDAFSGRQVRCPRCQNTFQAPGGGAVPEIPSPAPPASSPTPPGGMPVQLPARMLANRHIAGRTCPKCNTPIQLGVAVQNCLACSSSYHQECWTGACSVPTCSSHPQPPGLALPATMMANRQVAGKTCPRCNTPIQLGQPVQNCQSCSTSYHQGCWTGACTSAACPSRATVLAPMSAGPQQPPLDPSRPTKPCQFCGEVVDAAAMKCRFCNEWLDDRMRAGGPQGAAAKKLAGEALACGIIGLFCCGIILGPFAISKGNKANGMLQEMGQPTDGRATAGVVLGWIDVVLGVLFIFMRIAGNAAF